MTFDNDKKQCLSKMQSGDKSIKGSVDAPILPLVRLVNSLDNYYTTSSCSGRIVLFKEGRSKPESDWLYTTHEKAVLTEVLDSLTNIPVETVWFRQEGLILHVCARTNADANALLRVARDIGLKRSGIIGLSVKLMVEVASSEKMDVPITKGGKLIATTEQLEFFIHEANKKMEKNLETIKKLENEVNKKLN